MAEQRYYYADINADGVCYSVLDDADEQETGIYRIQLENCDFSVLGKKYENGVWVEAPKEEPATDPTETQPSNTEIKNLLLEVKEQNLILMESLAEMYEQSVDETTV